MTLEDYTPEGLLVLTRLVAHAIATVMALTENPA
jgi:hypothetical protein